jgi:DNA-binding transcriptional MocR family regulator
MTIWNPDLKTRGAPRYLAIAEALSEDIATGRLEPGTRLPTHRELAGTLGVTVGTVSRAYSEAHRRGLIQGEVGRGTFVRQATDDELQLGMPGEREAALIDLSMNFPVSDREDRALATTLASLASRRGLSGLLEYQPHAGAARHRAAGALWVGRVGLEARPEEIMICSGAQHAMAIVFSTLAKPGDFILTESLTYPGMKTLASLLHLKLQGLAMDDDGIMPDGFESACRGGRARMLYCVPTIQNPTATMMPESRRREIAAIALAHDVLIVEDDTYGLLPTDRPRPLSAFATDASLYIAGLAKSLAPGLRIAYLRAHAKLLERLVPGLRSTTWMAAPLMAEIASSWIHDGTADALLRRKREEAAERHRLATRTLGRHAAGSRPDSYHLWLRLPDGWQSDGFAVEARHRGVAVTPREAFAVGASGAPRGVRVCLGAARSRSQLEKGLGILSGILAGSPRADLSIV